MSDDIKCPVRVCPHICQLCAEKMNSQEKKRERFSPVLLSHFDSSWTSPSPLRVDEEPTTKQMDGAAFVKRLTISLNGSAEIDKNIPGNITLPALPTSKMRLSYEDCLDFDEEDAKDKETMWSTPTVPDKVQSITTQPPNEKRNEEEEDDRKPAAAASFFEGTTQKAPPTVAGWNIDFSVGVKMEGGEETDETSPRKKAKKTKFYQTTMLDWRLTTTSTTVSPDLPSVNTSSNADLERQLEQDERLAEMIYMEELSKYHNRNLPK